MKNDTQDTTQGSKKSPIALLNLLIMIFSAINTGVLVTVRLIYITSQQIGAASIVLGNIGTGIFFSSVSLVLDMYSFVNYLRGKSLYKRCHYKKTLDEVRKDKHRIQGICLGILCDMLFLTGAIASIALFGNPVAFFATAPLITLGCVLMVGNIANSIYHQVKNFKNHLSQLSKKEQKELYMEMKKEINSSLLYRIEAKVLPDVVVLAKLHANKEDVKERKKIKQLKEMLKGGSRKPIDDNIVDKDDRTIKTKKEKHTKRKKPNSKVPTHLSLDENVVEEREKESDTSRSL